MENNQSNSSFFEKYQAWIGWTIFAIAAIYGIYRAISLGWICDDAYISFRYARNLLKGHGLVFNVGERVEGYTNFLWTMLMALGMILKVTPELFSKMLSIASYLATVLIFLMLSRKLYVQENLKIGLLFIPMTAISLLLHQQHLVYATSGLETSLYTMLLSAGFVLLLFAEENKSYFFAGLVFILAMLTRPDGLIFYVMSLLYIFLTDKFAWKKFLYFLIPLLIIYIPYWIARYLYYGYPFPNTYYAKSGNLTYYKQGLSYIKIYFATYYVLAASPFIALLLFPRVLKGYWQEGFRLAKEYRPFTLSIMFMIPYIFYVVRVGGDFMFARFFIPITPFCYFSLESGTRVFFKDKLVLMLVFFLIIFGSFFHWDIYQAYGEDILNGIADEPVWYTEEKNEIMIKNGKLIGKYLNDPRIKIAFFGTQAMMVYYSDLPVAIESSAGLTDEFIAHLPLKKRGRPGHEKKAPHSYWFKRKVNFAMRETLTKLPYRKIYFEDYEAEILVYDKEVMDDLKKYETVKFIDFPSYLDEYIKNMDSYSAERIKVDYTDFKLFYFDHNNDESRQSRFIGTGI